MTIEWTPSEDGSKLRSSDFTHDVILIVNGDFADTEQRKAYAEKLAEKLNAPDATPSSKWYAQGEPDPHGGRYNGERAALMLGHLTDDELANAVFLHYDIRPPLQDIIDGKAHSPIAYVTAAKERIRWLSRALERAIDESARTENKLYALINDMMVIAEPVMNAYAGNTRVDQFHAALTSATAKEPRRKAGPE